MSNCHLTVRPDGSVTRHGIETPSGSRVVAMNAETIVVKIPGHKVWAGLLMDPRYEPAQLIVYDLLEECRKGKAVPSTVYRVKERIRWPVREGSKSRGGK